MNSNNNKALVKEALLEACIMAVIRADRAEKAAIAARALGRGGIRALEVTMTVPGAVDVIRSLAGQTDAIVGAGTVLTAQEVGDCADAGAQFIVSPACIEEVVAAAQARHLVVIPGAFTPTEVLRAWRLGADFVKIFPASRLGPRFLADLRGPLPGIPLVPTGGVTAANAREYLEAGASLLGLGSWLLDRDSMDSQSMDAPLKRAQQLVAVVKQFRQENA